MELAVPRARANGFIYSGGSLFATDTKLKKGGGFAKLKIRPNKNSREKIIVQRFRFLLVARSSGNV